MSCQCIFYSQNCCRILPSPKEPVLYIHKIASDLLHPRLVGLPVNSRNVNFPRGEFYNKEHQESNKSETCPVRRFRRTARPCSSKPWTWKTCFAVSSPIIFNAIRYPSSPSESDYVSPDQVHTIRSGGCGQFAAARRIGTDAPRSAKLPDNRSESGVEIELS